MKNSNLKERALFFFLGIIAVFIIISITGASDAPLPNYGRFQISSFATSVGDTGGCIIGGFVVDTVTGEVKTAYSRSFKDLNKNEILINNLKKSFISME